jgi:hypothetical protein
MFMGNLLPPSLGVKMVEAASYDKSSAIIINST